MQTYFRAFRYLTTIFNLKAGNAQGNKPASQEITVYAEKWIESYSGFISPSWSALV